MQIRKPGTLKKVGRILTGPEVAGSRPVLVTFPTFPAREEVWKRAGRLRGSSFYVSEDVTKWAALPSLLVQASQGLPDRAEEVHEGGEDQGPRRRVQVATPS